MKALLLASVLLSTSACASIVYRDDISLDTFRPPITEREPIYFKSLNTEDYKALYCIGPEDWTMAYWDGPCAPVAKPLEIFTPIFTYQSTVPLPGAFWLLASVLGLLVVTWRRWCHNGVTGHCQLANCTNKGI